MNQICKKSMLFNTIWKEAASKPGLIDMFSFETFLMVVEGRSWRVVVDRYKVQSCQSQASRDRWRSAVIQCQWSFVNEDDRSSVHSSSSAINSTADEAFSPVIDISTEQAMITYVSPRKVMTWNNEWINCCMTAQTVMSQ